MAFCPFTILLPIVCGLIAGTPQPVDKEQKFMTHEALCVGFAFCKYIYIYVHSILFLQTSKEDTYPEQRPPGQGRWWWRSWCRFVMYHCCTCRCSLSLLYHLQHPLNVGRDQGPSPQLQWSHMCGMFIELHLHCSELVSYVQRGFILYSLKGFLTSVYFLDRHHDFTSVFLCYQMFWVERFCFCCCEISFIISWKVLP